LPNKQAAAELGSSEKTIEAHRTRIMEKMNAKSVADLVRIADQALKWSMTKELQHTSFTAFIESKIEWRSKSPCPQLSEH